MAFAVSDVHAAARGTTTPLSPEYLYYQAIMRTPGRDPEQGVALGTILNALRLDGQCAESGWSYLPILPNNIAHWVPPASAVPVFKRESEFGVSKVANIIEELDAGTPVVVTFLMGERFYDPIDGVVTAGPNDPDIDYHAVVAVGHGRRGSQRYVLVRNSWGEDWGFNGHAWIDADYLEARLDGTATLSKVEIV